jgi:hypothetical protein
MKSKIFLPAAAAVLLAAMLAFPASASADRYGPGMRAAADSWDRSEGDPSHVIDRDTDTIWHSLWDVQAAVNRGYEDAQSSENIYPQILIVEFDGVYTLDCIGYLARSYHGSRNGTVLQYEFWASETGTLADLHSDDGWSMIADGVWDEYDDEFFDGVFKRVDFDPVRARAIKLKVLRGVGGWASCAELQFGFTDAAYIPMDGFTPRTPPPGMPAREEEAGAAVPAEPAEEGGGGQDNEAPADITVTDEENEFDAAVLIIVLVLAGVLLAAAAAITAAVKLKQYK